MNNNVRKNHPEVHKSILIKDILWYFVGSVVPLLIGLLKSPIYTRVFSPADYGAYSLVFISFNYLSVICYSWIISCAWRFFHQYKEKGEINRLFSNLVFLYALFSLVILIVSCVWFLGTKELLIKKLIFLCFLQFCFSEITSLFFIKHRLEGDTLYYNTLQSIRVIASFGLLSLFTFVFDWGIESFLISNIVVDALLLIVVSFSVKLDLSVRLISKEELKVFFDYGRIGFVINISSMLLVSSDRFIIEYFAGLQEVGIYNQNYNIAQISIMMLINVYWTALNPYLLPVLEFRPSDMKKILGDFFKIYVIVFTPLCAYFLLYAKQIAQVMLGEDFQCGYAIIYWVAISEFISGLYFISITNLKFKNNLKRITLAYLLALLVNVLLNIVLIPRCGYQVAGFTTFVSNVILFVGFCLPDRDINYGNLFKDKCVLWPVLVLVSHFLCHIISVDFIGSFVYYLFEGLVWAVLYYLVALKYTNVINLLNAYRVKSYE